MFLDNKYRRIYYNLVENARKLERSGYLERHHIIPRSLGGTNSKDNLVSLTFREHFICHRLLPRFTVGTARNKMLTALWCMTWNNRKHRARTTLTSRQYAICKQACSEAASQYRHTPEAKRKISEGLKKYKKTAEHKTNIGKSSKGRVMPQSMRESVKKRVAGTGNPRALGWKIIHENGEEVIIKSLKTWCRENKLPIWQFYDTDYKDRFYNGVKAVKLSN